MLDIQLLCILKETTRISQNKFQNALLRDFNEYFMSATGTKSATTKS